MQNKVLERIGIKRYVKLENGQIERSYYDYRANMPRRFEKTKKGIYMHYDKPLIQNGRPIGIACCCCKVIATADTKEELEEVEK